MLFDLGNGSLFVDDLGRNDGLGFDDCGRSVNGLAGSKYLLRFALGGQLAFVADHEITQHRESAILQVALQLAGQVGRAP